MFPSSKSLLIDLGQKISTLKQETEETQFQVNEIDKSDSLIKIFDNSLKFLNYIHHFDINPYFYRFSSDNGADNFFNINKHIALHDHFFDPSQDKLNKLLELYFFVEVTNFHNIDISDKSVLLEKLGFLIEKILLRYKVEKNLSAPYNLRLYLRSVEKRLEDPNIFKLCEKLKEELNHINIIYELDPEWKKRLKEEALRILDKDTPIRQLTYKELHVLIKYYKDVCIDSLENLKLKLKQIFEEIQFRYRNEPFNNSIKRSALISSIYALNNWFSKCLEEKTNLPNHITSYNFTEAYHQENRIYNFFPEYKIIQKIYESAIQETESENTINELEKHIAIAEEIIKNYESKINWSKMQYNYLFLPHPEECIYNLSEINSVFIYSAFILPLPSERFTKEFEQSKNRTAILKNASKLLVKLDNKITDQDKIVSSIERRETKSIETIGIFTAIVTVLLGSITGFQFIKSIPQAIAFTLSLSTSLGFFVSFLFYIFSSKEEKSTNGVVVSAFVIGAIVIWSVFLLMDPFRFMSTK